MVENIVRISCSEGRFGFWIEKCDAAQSNIRVAYVASHSSAEESGLRTGALILRIDFIDVHRLEVSTTQALIDEAESSKRAIQLVVIHHPERDDAVGHVVYDQSLDSPRSMPEVEHTLTTDVPGGVVRIVRKQAYPSSSSAMPSSINPSTTPAHVIFKPKHRHSNRVRLPAGQHSSTVIGVVLDRQSTNTTTTDTNPVISHSRTRPLSDNTNDHGHFYHYSPSDRSTYTSSSVVPSTNTAMSTTNESSVNRPAHVTSLHSIRLHQTSPSSTGVGSSICSSGGPVRYRSAPHHRCYPQDCYRCTVPMMTRVGGIVLSQPSSPPTSFDSAADPTTTPSSDTITRVGPGPTITQSKVSENRSPQPQHQYLPRPYVTSRTLEERSLDSDNKFSNDRLSETLSLPRAGHMPTPPHAQQQSFDTSELGPTPKYTPSSDAGVQFARTLRHLRRLRHIYGDSLPYSASANSSSMGALSARRSCAAFRNKTSRSVESVCEPVEILADCKCHLLPHNEQSGREYSASVRFITATGITSWQKYRFRLVDDWLILTLSTADFKASLECNSDSILQDRFSHLHIPLSSNNSLIRWEVVGDTDNRHHHHDRDAGGSSSDLILTCRITFEYFPGDQPFDCELQFESYELACRALGRWVPSDPSSTAAAATDSKHHSIFGGHHGGALHTRSVGASLFRGRAGRTSSLGIAGPPGANPLVQAIGTAAASIGMQLGGVGATVTKPSSAPPGTADKKEDKSRGRFHQALNRMRRAATASGAAIGGAPSRSSDSQSAGRRFASSHGALFSTGSSTTKSSSAFASSSDAEPQSFSTDVGTYPLLAVESSTTSPTVNSAIVPSQQRSQYHAASIEASVSSNMHSELQSNTSVPSDHLGALDIRSTTGVNSNRSISGQSDLTASRVQVTLEASPSVRPVGFIPLPGPTALYHCPRSTLSPFVPFLVEFCVTLVERYGLNCVGIYRLSGSKVAHDFISTELRKDIREIDVVSEKWNDIHAVCGVLKTFLRQLPDSLFPKVMYPDFIAACRHSQREKRLLSIQRLLCIMECYPMHPEYRMHRATLRYLATHLGRVSARKTVNRMTTYNLALVFAPNLVQPCDDRPELLMSDSKYKIMLVEMVIKYHEWIFSPDLGLESGCAVPPDSTEDLSVVGTEVEMSLSSNSRPPSSYVLADPPSISSITAAAGTTSIEFPPDDPANQPGRVEGDVQPLVAELLNAASNLPPPPSTLDLETAVVPGPESDRPSDVTAAKGRPRCTSIPTSSWSVAANYRNISPAASFDHPSESHDEASQVDPSPPPPPMSLLKALPQDASLGLKLESLRNLSQGCLQEYSDDARRQVEDRVAECRTRLERTIAQRKEAEQRLLEARGDSQLTDPNPSCTHSPPSIHHLTIPPSSLAPSPIPSTSATGGDRRSKSISDSFEL